MKSYCKLCRTHSADIRRVGTVDVVVCLACDRARCHACNRSLPGTARTCPSCGTALVFQ